MRVHLLTARALQLSPEAKSSHSQRTTATHAPLCGSLVQAAVRLSCLLALIHTLARSRRAISLISNSLAAGSPLPRGCISHIRCHSARTV
ncbi:hypothetical protein SRHO_G00127730 [Serrasalmus rhombeus]